MKNTTFIIHFRRDCEDRIFNLKTILKYLYSNNPLEIIVINDDNVVDPIMKWVKTEYPTIKLLFCENEDEFKKSYCFNMSALQSTGDVLCFYDVDVLVSQAQLEESQNLILSGQADHVYPFNGIFIDVKKKFFPMFIDTFNFVTLNNEVTDTTLGFYNGNINIISDKSPGGCNLISKKAFQKIGGYDENFIGWGFEDTDFRERSKKKNNVRYLEGDKYLYHLEHITHCDQDRSQQPYYGNNYKQFILNQK
jgi:predicted glycosyltransferase involved in capsule biosynthesis